MRALFSADWSEAFFLRDLWAAVSDHIGIGVLIEFPFSIDFNLFFRRDWGMMKLESINSLGWLEILIFFK